MSLFFFLVFFSIRFLKIRLDPGYTNAEINTFEILRGRFKVSYFLYGVSFNRVYATVCLLYDISTRESNENHKTDTVMKKKN